MRSSYDRKQPSGLGLGRTSRERGMPLPGSPLGDRMCRNTRGVALGASRGYPACLPPPSRWTHYVLWALGAFGSAGERPTSAPVARSVTTGRVRCRHDGLMLSRDGGDAEASGVSRRCSLASPGHRPPGAVRPVRRRSRRRPGCGPPPQPRRSASAESPWRFATAHSQVGLPA